MSTRLLEELKRLAHDPQASVGEVAAALFKHSDGDGRITLAQAVQFIYFRRAYVHPPKSES